MATPPGATRVSAPAPRRLAPAQCRSGSQGTPLVGGALAALGPAHAPRVASVAVGPAPCERSHGPDSLRCVCSLREFSGGGGAGGWKPVDRGKLPGSGPR